MLPGFNNPSHVILLPLQEAEAFRGNFDRDRFILNPPGGGQISLSRILNRQTLHRRIRLKTDLDLPLILEATRVIAVTFQAPVILEERGRGAYIPPAPSNPTYPSPSPKPEPEPGPSPIPILAAAGEAIRADPAEAQAFALLNETRANNNLPRWKSTTDWLKRHG